MNRDQERLCDILEAIQRVQKYAARGRAVFDNDELVQSWILQHVQIIGEATRNLSEDFRNNHPEIPWAEIIRMRHVLVHDYFKVDEEILWSVVQTDIPKLKQQVEKLVQQFPTD